MKKLFWMATGITVGLIAAKEIEKNPKAKAALADATDRLRILAQSFVDGYAEESKPARKPATKNTTTSKSPK